MAKKAAQSSASRNATAKHASDVVSLWTPTDLLEAGDSKETLMTAARLEETMPFLPAGTQAVLPSPDERADWCRKNWVCFYFYPFDIQLHFPFPKLVRDLVTDMHISPGQLMPFAWRILACLDAIDTKHNLKIDIEVVKCCYGFKRFYGCRFGFTTKRALILNVEGVNDRNWKDDYFFTDKTTMGDGTGFLLDRWTPRVCFEHSPSLCLFICTCILLMLLITILSFVHFCFMAFKSISMFFMLERSTPFDNKNETAKEIVEKIMSLPVGDRIWPNCLGRPIRNSSPVDVDEFIRKMEADERALGKQASKTVAARTRSRAVAVASRMSSTPQTVSSDSLESPKTEKGLEASSSRLFAKEFKLSGIKPPSISTKDMFVKRARDEKSIGTSSSKAPALLSPSLSPEAKKMKVATPSAATNT
ncbi:uncharacterized protein LOC108193822 isoform X2 [Daucus carota subsp. sativus]|uniref:uncharacterized protein LOC108193822 isoform X2 n=1 Tax=Daucus carota subsp. sativus TaxID=79200 RepID=UPI0030835BF5